MSSQEKPLFISCPLPLNSHSPKPSQPEHRLICNRFPLLCLVGTQKVAKGECSLKERTHKRGNSAPPHSCQFSPPGLKLGPSSPRAKTAPGPRVSQAFQRRPAQPLPLLLTGLPVLVHQVTDVCTLHFHPTVLLHMVHCGPIRKNMDAPFPSASRCYDVTLKETLITGTSLKTSPESPNLRSPSGTRHGGGSTGLLLLTTPPE